MKLTSPLRKWVVVSIFTAGLGVAVGAGGAEYARQYVVEGPSAAQIIFLPGGNTANNSDIAKLDTRTGAVYRFRGDVNNPSVRNTWELRVEPVKEAHSGMLEIQRIVAPPARPNNNSTVVTFLADIVTGQTWILRHRASTNASWDLVTDYHHYNPRFRSH